jgi:hypothetical protein
LTAWIFSLWFSAVTRTFLGFASPPSRYRIIVVPAQMTAAALAPAVHP